MQELDERIAAIRAGQRLPADVGAFLDQGRLSDAARRAFEAALAQPGNSEREHVAKALLAVGQRADPPAPLGIPLLQEPRVIALLAGAGLRAGGAARDVALEALLGSVPLLLLQTEGPAIAAELAAHPDGDSLRLAAKAKPPEAKPLVQQMIASPAWSANESARIAAAAFGDARIESEFIGAFEQSKDGATKARLARVLANIGTPRSLAALAAAMRSDIVIEMPMVMRRSVRVDIVAALSFAFPDKAILWDNAVQDDSGYARIEAFCEHQFSTRWTQPRPPFLWIEGFPADPEY
jgi:hypothetical protein